MSWDLYRSGEEQDRYLHQQNQQNPPSNPDPGDPYNEIPKQSTKKVVGCSGSLQKIVLTAQATQNIDLPAQAQETQNIDLPVQAQETQNIDLIPRQTLVPEPQPTRLILPTTHPPQTPLDISEIPEFLRLTQRISAIKHPPTSSSSSRTGIAHSSMTNLWLYHLSNDPPHHHHWLNTGDDLPANVRKSPPPPQILEYLP